MSLISLTFAIFFAAVLLLYYLLPRVTQPYLLLAASLVFYLWSGPKYIAYIAVSASVTYAAALLAGRTSSRFAAVSAELKSSLPPEEYKKKAAAAARKGRLIIGLALAVDLAILVVIKYLDFILGNILPLFGGAAARFAGLRLVMPLGLSYFTFGAVGYLIDVSRGKYPAERNFAKFALYMTYFPHIIQGPIPRFDKLAPQFSVPHSFDIDRILDGFRLILWGCFKILMLSASLAPAVSAMADSHASMGGLEIWLRMTAWGLQLYADFSGGIDIVTGVSECFGIGLEENFRRPYFATDLTDYWNRWHISLSGWLKDYVFYPMALSKRFARFSKYLKKKHGKFIAKTVPVGLLSILLFTLVGLWHGANWGEILFGVFNGVIIMTSTLLEPLFQKIRKPLKMDSLLIWRIFRSLRTFIVITLTRVISRAPGIPAAMSFYRKMFTSPGIGGFISEFSEGGRFAGFDILSYLPVFIGAAALFAVSLTEEITPSHSVRKLLSERPVLRVALEVLCVAVIVVFGTYGLGYDASGFIYAGN